MSFPGSILLTQGDQYVQTSDKRHPLGTRGYTRDGRVFRYSRAGATALTVGKLMQSAVAHADFKQDKDPATSTAPSTGSRTVTVQYSATATTIAANYFADGYLYVDDGTGEGQLVQLSGNSVPDCTTANTSGNIDVYLREDQYFTVAPTTACEISLTKNKYDYLVIRPAAHASRTGVPTGVTPRAVTELYYFWLQTWGPCPCITSGTVIIGNPVCDSSCTLGETSATAGAVHAGDTSTTALTTTPGLSLGVGFKIGNVMQVGAAGEYSLIDLCLAP